ncbi:unnamed protein product [Spirodela intermedia]|uniref:PHD finger protein ALFIN-LIKE n=1 Tax=Spirodela intermedia TaxID=51605 RepID=A0A7I8J1Q7_SPIIN|nr:unnamed protein product [Spirodela intermedia]CAA6663902.1 unnamed protein product [Spirodela intermedia]
MEGASGPFSPRTAEEVFKDFRGRRAGMIKALTTDVEKFFQQCDPEKENLCLYGLPNETWEVTLPAEEVPPELPEPDWLALVAVHSDAWLLAVAFYFGARFGFDKDARRRLFNMINNLPDHQQTKEKAPSSGGKANSKSNSKKAARRSTPRRRTRGRRRSWRRRSPEGRGRRDFGEDEEEEEHGNTLCGACGDNYANDEFWICCDICERWFHGECVKITPAKAEHIKQYKCPACSNKKSRLV